MPTHEHERREPLAHDDSPERKARRLAHLTQMCGGNAADAQIVDEMGSAMQEAALTAVSQVMDEVQKKHPKLFGIIAQHGLMSLQSSVATNLDAINMALMLEQMNSLGVGIQVIDVDELLRRFGKGQG